MSPFQVMSTSVRAVNHDHLHFFEKVCVCVVAHARRNGGMAEWRNGGGRWSLTIATEQRTVLGDVSERPALGWFDWQWRRLGYQAPSAHRVMSTTIPPSKDASADGGDTT